MRFLRLLFFLVVFLSSSFSFATFTKEEFQAGRTERYGYSFYNNEPVYVATIHRDDFQTMSYSLLSCVRLQTGVDPDDLGFLSNSSGYYRIWDPVSEKWVLLVTASDASSGPETLTKFATRSVRSRLLFGSDNFFDLFDYVFAVVRPWLFWGVILGLFVLSSYLLWALFVKFGQSG